MMMSHLLFYLHTITTSHPRIFDTFRHFHDPPGLCMWSCRTDEIELVTFTGELKQEQNGDFLLTETIVDLKKLVWQKLFHFSILTIIFQWIWYRRRSDQKLHIYWERSKLWEEQNTRECSSSFPKSLWEDVWLEGSGSWWEGGEREGRLDQTLSNG